MQQYDLISQFPVGVRRHPYKGFAAYLVATPDGEIVLPNPMYDTIRGYNICGVFYATIDENILEFKYYTAAVVGRWPFNTRLIGENTQVVARFASTNAGTWEKSTF